MKQSKTKPWKLKFWTPGHRPGDDGTTIGCASQGLCKGQRWVAPGDEDIVTWEYKLYGDIFAGTFKDVLEAAGTLSFKPRNGLVFFAHTDGTEDFLYNLNRKIGPLNLAGGATARKQGERTGDVMPAAEDVVLLLLDPDVQPVSVESFNLHSEKTTELEIRRSGSREIESVRLKGQESWQSGLGFYRDRQKTFGVAPDDFESLTLTDKTGRNLHCSVQNNRLAVGANLPTDNRLYLSRVMLPDLRQKVAEKLRDTNSLIFCCAGIGAHLQQPMPTAEHVLCTFLYGEVVTFTEQPLFGNLMLSRLRLADG